MSPTSYRTAPPREDIMPGSSRSDNPHSRAVRESPVDGAAVLRIAVVSERRRAGLLWERGAGGRRIAPTVASRPASVQRARS